MEHATLENTRCNSEMSDEARTKLTEYLSAFLAPVTDEKCVRCPCCDSQIWSGGGVMDALLSTFTWGIAHGDGFCSRCRWPIRMYHFVQLDGPEKTRMTFPLAYVCYEDEAHAVEIEPKAKYHERTAATA